jgi:hypothetical protein
MLHPKKQARIVLTVDFDIMLSWGRVSLEFSIASSAALSQDHIPASYK